MKMKFSKQALIMIFAVFLVSCMGRSQSQSGAEQEGQIDIKNLDVIIDQYTLLLDKALKDQNIPRTIEEGKLRWVNDGFDWTEGFFPGSLWYLYEITGDESWKNGAIELQKLIYEDRFASNHDLGFVFNCSYGNGLRLTKDSSFTTALVDAANTLLGRFDPRVGVIKSWDADRGWQGERGWEYPVIIDNMMNLELLFRATQITGDPSYWKTAEAHATKTMKNHFREDGSSYHVIDYDSVNGEVRSKVTAQGFSDESSWARGQAWGLYGYIVCYRFTRDVKYLELAQKIAEVIMNNNSVKEGNIPFWDYHAPNIPNEPVDASAAAITASALFEISSYTKGEYEKYAEEIIQKLSSPTYLAKPGTNKGFILKHNVGSLPHNNEIDVPLNYADYYYLEALIRSEI